MLYIGVSLPGWGYKCLGIESLEGYLRSYQTGLLPRQDTNIVYNIFSLC
jgi:hypothetical protein